MQKATLTLRPWEARKEPCRPLFKISTPPMPSKADREGATSIASSSEAVLCDSRGACAALSTVAGIPCGVLLEEAPVCPELGAPEVAAAVADV